MSDLIPSMTITEFRKLKASEIKELKALEIVSDGEYLFTAMIPHGDYIAKDYIKVQAEYLAVKANITGGKEPAEVMEKVEV